MKRKKKRKIKISREKCSKKLKSHGCKRISIRTEKLLNKFELRIAETISAELTRSLSTPNLIPYRVS